MLLLIGGCASETTHFQIKPDQGLVLDDTPFFPQSKYQCGPASLAMLLGASGVATTPEALVPYTFIPGRRGSLQLELVAASRRYNRIPYVIDPDITALANELRGGRPVLVLQNLGLNILPAYHYAVVIGLLPPDTIVLRSGVNKRVAMDVEKFLATWKREDSWGMIVLQPGELPANPDPFRYLDAVSAFEMGGNLMQAEKCYQAARAAWPENETVLFALGTNFLYQKKYRAAETVFRKLIQNNPNHIAAFNNLAETLDQRGCHAEAYEVIDVAAQRAGTLHSPLHEAVLQTRREIARHLHQPGPAFPTKCASQP